MECRLKEVPKLLEAERRACYDDAEVSYSMPGGFGLTPAERLDAMWNMDVPVEEARVYDSLSQSRTRHLREGWVHGQYERLLGLPVRPLSNAAMDAFEQYRIAQLYVLRA